MTDIILQVVKAIALLALLGVMIGFPLTLAWYHVYKFLDFYFGE